MISAENAKFQFYDLLLTNTEKIRMIYLWTQNWLMVLSLNLNTQLKKRNKEIMLPNIWKLHSWSEEHYSRGTKSRHFSFLSDLLSGVKQWNKIYWTKETHSIAQYKNQLRFSLNSSNSNFDKISFYFCIISRRRKSLIHHFI